MQSSIFAFDSIHLIDCAPAADTSVNTFECKQPPEGEKRRGTPRRKFRPTSRSRLKLISLIKVLASSPAWGTNLTSDTKKRTEINPRKALLCALLANSAGVVAAGLHFPFQQQIHRRLRQVAAGSPRAQWGSVVKGSHVALFFSFL